MKRILITGANSYIGTSFEEWMTQWPEEYQVDCVGTRNDEWKELDFSKYDVIFHVAGIAHIKETTKNEYLYYEVNRDLTIYIAKKAKEEGVTQFIFLSSMSVYGLNQGVITEDTLLNPQNTYGKSKLEAEKGIQKLHSNDFFVAILRPPMIYGKNCKGNYQKLSKFAKITPFFPNYINQRSMIYIDNLSQFVKLIIDSNNFGIFFPQNEEYVCTSEMVKKIASIHNNKICTSSIFNHLIGKLNKSSFINKIFGDLVYEKNLPPKNNLHQIEFTKTLQYTEGEQI